jgi:hypothetical protein
MRSVAFLQCAETPLGVERVCTERGIEKEYGGEAEEEEGFRRSTCRIIDDVNQGVRRSAHLASRGGGRRRTRRRRMCVQLTDV